MIKTIIEIITKIIKAILMFCGGLFIIECIYLAYILNDKQDYCLDSNICEEGLEINTEHGLMKINQENCEKYGYIWLGSSCDLRKKPDI